MSYQTYTSVSAEKDVVVVVVIVSPQVLSAQEGKGGCVPPVIIEFILGSYESVSVKLHSPSTSITPPGVAISGRTILVKFVVQVLCIVLIEL